MREFRIHGMAHITGGGLTDNLPRMIPERCQAVIDTSSWTPPAIFKYLQGAGRLSFKEMMRTFNNGIGLVLVVGKEEVEEVISNLKGMGESAFHLGEVKPRGKRKEGTENSRRRRRKRRREKEMEQEEEEKKAN